MDSIIVFVLQALFACIFFSACTSVANGRLIALSEEPFPFMPNRVDVLTGVRARLVGLGLILLMAVSFALAYNFNTIIFGNLLYTNSVSVLAGFTVWFPGRKYGKLK
jgi:hypothetical protein